MEKREIIIALALLAALPLSAQKEERESLKLSLPKVSGFVNARYQYDSSDDSNGFDVRRARLDFKGDVGANVDYRLQVEFSNDPKILDAYVRWKPAKELSFQVGQFKIPFSLENIYGPTSLETVENSIAISRLVGYNDVSGLKDNGRDVGVGLYGGFARQSDGRNLIDYSLGVFNGQGINLKKDANTHKDFSGRIIINPVSHLNVSGSYYNGSYQSSPAGRIKRERAGGGLKWDDKRLLLRSEYIYGKTGGVESEGVYAIAAYKFVPKVQALLKWDYFQEDKQDGDSRERYYTTGINYFANKHLRLQLNYTYKSFQAKKNSSYVVAQVFAQF